MLAALDFVVMERPLDEEQQYTAARGGGLQRVSMAAIQLIASIALILSILIAGAVITMGIADAQSANTSTPSDASLIVALLAIAVAVMGILSAATVRFTGRSRGR